MTAAAGPQLHPDSWQLLQLLDQAPGFHALSDALSDLVAGGVEVAALTADLKYSNGLVRFAERHPERFFQFGISEQNMVSAAAGMAASGVVPFAATFGSFLALLCCEQIRTDVAWQNLPVRLIGHHSGIALGFYGTSHHTTEDLGILRTIANLTIVAPADATALRQAVAASRDVEGPIYFRVGRGRDEPVYDEAAPPPFAFGRGNQLRDGSDAVIVAVGSTVRASLDAAELLAADGLDVGVIDVSSIKPLDGELILRATARTRRVMTVEEHNRVGGLGAAVAEVLAESGVRARLHRHGIPDEYSLVGPPTHLYRHYRLDAGGIAAELLEWLERG
jgi:transketolase